ncbi:hypothetical protein MPER_04523, partial [Moniliophthora perniciosa FA553]
VYHGVYKPGNLADGLTQFMAASFGARPNAFLKGVRVRTIHLGYKKTIKGMSNLTARQHSFHCEEFGKKVTVEEYFKRKYRITLRYADKPLVDVGGQKSNLLPAEVCEILPNQPFRGKLHEEHTAAMIRVAARPPNVNGGEIMSAGLSNLGFSEASSVMKAFGVQVGKQMAVVPGRILPPPGIVYGRGTPQAGLFGHGAGLLIKDNNDRDEFQDNRDPELMKTIKGFLNMCNTSRMNAAELPNSASLKTLLPKAGMALRGQKQVV